MIILIYNESIEYNVFDGSNCQIVNSYLIKDKTIKIKFINHLLSNFECFKKRSIKSYYREWKAHNILYKWHFRVESTKDTDLNVDEPFIRRIGYFLLSLFKE